MLLTTPNKTNDPPGTIWNTENPPVHLWWFSETSLRFIAYRLAANIEFYDFSRYSASQGRLAEPLPHEPSPRPPFLNESGQVIHYKAAGSRWHRAKQQFRKFFKGSILKSRILTSIYLSRQGRIRIEAARTKAACVALSRADCIGVILRPSNVQQRPHTAARIR